ncbi:MAG TPA: hypothetical protein DCK76_00595 [Desulfotomaculum sp.]|nr:MAG: Uncharacterized protein XD84_1869 [Desulfotomaculum sp. 46_80]KUK85102.1 MAG: Uncharacterized protein XE00_0287 [Desulfofundulus kuznetsovii]HAG09917.1 hypothetical protein [Desulfotomaculum sp.]HBY04625.1 hypothetical protein [Desulfotomaculum sp.]
MNLADIIDFLSRHRGKATGIVIGLIFGWLVIKYGIIKSIFVAICMGIGYYVGKRLDENLGIRDIFYSIFRKD